MMLFVRFLILSLTLLSFNSAFSACKVARTPNFYFAFDFSLNDQFIFNSKGSFKEDLSEGFSVYGCDEEAQQKKYIALGWGAVFYGLDAKSKDVSYSDRVDIQECKINNSLFEIESSDKLNQEYKNRFKILNSCLKFKVTSLNNLPLVMSKNETACKVQMINRSQAYIYGSYCFIRILPQSQYKVEIEQNSECRENLRMNLNSEIKLTEVTAIMTTAVVGDDSGNSMDHTLLGSKIMQIHFNPTNMFNLTNNWIPRSPSFIAEMEFPKLHFGEPRIENTPSGSLIQMKYFADNRCKNKCVDGFCYSPCNYSTPAFGEYSLFRIKKNKKEYIASWFDGGVLPPQWNGQFAGDIKNLMGIKFEHNTDYVLEFVIRDPKVEYQSYVNTRRNLMPPIPGIVKWDSMNELFAGTSTILPISSVSDLGDSGDLSEDDLSFNGTPLHLRLKDEIELMTENMYWPAIYSKVCKSNNCVRVGHNPIYKNEMTFKVILENEIVIISDLKQSVVTKFGEKTNLSQKEFPSLVCSYEAKVAE